MCETVVVWQCVNWVSAGVFTPTEVFPVSIPHGYQINLQRCQVDQPFDLLIFWLLSRISMLSLSFLVTPCATMARTAALKMGFFFKSTPWCCFMRSAQGLSLHLFRAWKWCSLSLTLIFLAVSPMYCSPHMSHVRRYTTFSRSHSCSFNQDRHATQSSLGRPLERLLEISCSRNRWWT